MNNNKKIKETEELYKMLFLDFKDEFGYKADIKELKKMSAVQKWFIYDNYAKPDADVVIKNNKLLGEILGWDTDMFDAMFSARQIINTLLRTIGQKINTDDMLEGRKEIYDIIGGAAITQILRNAGEEHVRMWHNRFKKYFEKFCENVHTIGNYMPCPDNVFNTFKGFNRWHYNDRLDLLYTDILERKHKNKRGEYIMTSEQQTQWKAWFDENEKKLFLTDILDEENLGELGKFHIKQMTFSDEELKKLPEFLHKINELIELRSLIIRTLCTRGICNILTECYKDILSEFDRGKIFLQVSDDGKGYAWVDSECEKQFDNCGIAKLFPFKYFDERPIDKLTGEVSCKAVFEYTYLSLYDCYLNSEISAGMHLSIDILEDRAVYFAFKECGLLKEPRRNNEKENNTANDSTAFELTPCFLPIHKDEHCTVKIDFYPTPAILEFNFDNVSTFIDINGKFICGSRKNSEIFAKWLSDVESELEDIIWEWESGNDEFELIGKRVI